MKLRTKISPRAYPFSISYQSKILSLGSCFAENIGSRLGNHLFDILVNPNGIIYHPLPLARILSNMIRGKTYAASDLIQNQELFYSFDHHGSHSGADSDRLLTQLNEQAVLASERLKSAEMIFITFGTSWAYFHKTRKEWVANCHKIPQREFLKEMISLEVMFEKWEVLIQEIITVNPDIKFIFSVSPIRHLKDGLVENSISKANLRLLIEGLRKKFEAVFYFPAFEIMMDDLRDYRFYESDLLHPSALAQDYIWNYFQQSFFQTKTKSNFQSVEQIVKSAAHRPFHPEMPAHQKFVEQQLAKIDQLQSKMPAVNFLVLKEKFREQLHAK